MMFLTWIEGNYQYELRANFKVDETSSCDSIRH